MSIVLPKELEDLIQDKVASGAYDSVEEVIAEAVKLLDRRDDAIIARNRKLQWLREAWRKGVESSDFGPLTREELRALAKGETINRSVSAK